MNDFIQRIGPVERDIDPVYRVDRAHDDEGGGKPPEQRKKRQPPEHSAEQPEGPVEGDDGHLHIDVRA